MNNYIVKITKELETEVSSETMEEAAEIVKQAFEKGSSLIIIREKSTTYNVIQKKEGIEDEK